MALSLQDEPLRKRLQQGDENALEEIIRRYTPRYTPYAGTIVWNIVRESMSHSEAEEVLSEVFFSLWQHADAIRPGKLKSYLASIARSKAIDAVRRLGKERPLEEDELLSLRVSGPEEEIVQRSEQELVREAVDSLGEPDRTIFLQHYWLLQKTSVIAEELGLNVNTVQSRLHRGREVLRRKLEKGGISLG